MKSNGLIYISFSFIVKDDIIFVYIVVINLVYYNIFL